MSKNHTKNNPLLKKIKSSFNKELISICGKLFSSGKNDTWKKNLKKSAEASELSLEFPQIRSIEKNKNASINLYFSILILILQKKENVTIKIEKGKVTIE